MTDKEFNEMHLKYLTKVYLPLAETYRSVLDPKMAKAIGYDGADKFPVKLFIKNLMGEITYLLFSEKMMPSIEDRFANANMEVPLDNDPEYDKKCLDMLVYNIADYMFYHKIVIKLQEFEFLNNDNYGIVIPSAGDSLVTELSLFNKVVGSYVNNIKNQIKESGTFGIVILGKLAYSESIIRVSYTKDLALMPNINPDAPDADNIIKYYMIGWMCRKVLMMHCSLRFLFEGSLV